MRALISNMLYYLGWAAFKANVHYRIYNRLMQASLAVQGNGRGPWGDRQ